MSLTQFAMVEELASLVKDNLPCKHLILSIEEMLVDFLQDDTSVGGVLELEPMNSYERLLVHRLADIFGFSHHSTGEGDARHLILEHCPETSIPPILVTDLLWQFGEVPSPMIFDVPRQKKVMPDQSDIMASEASSLEERETKYRAARDRIFADMQTVLVKPRPKNDTVVARRMIAHALGKTNKEMTQERSSSDTKKHGQTIKAWKIQQVDKGEVCPSSSQDSNSLSTKRLGSWTSSDTHNFNGFELSSTRKVAQQKINLVQQEEGSAAEQRESSIHENHMRNNEHMGAAKRLFANALGIQKREINQPKHSITKKTNG